MKKQNEIELVGIGKVRLYPIKAEQKEFEMCNKDLKPLKKAVAEKGSRAVYKFLDSDNNEYTKEEVGYNINGNFLQKVKRTEKVNKFNVVDRTNIIGNFMGESYFILDADDTALNLLEKQIGNDKALEFVYKSSSIGFKWRKAYIYAFQNCFVMAIGVGYILDGVAEFMKQKTAVKQITELKEVVVSAKADEIEIEI